MNLRWRQGLSGRVQAKISGRASAAHSSAGSRGPDVRNLQQRKHRMPYTEEELLTPCVADLELMTGPARQVIDSEPAADSETDIELLESLEGSDDASTVTLLPSTHPQHHVSLLSRLSPGDVQLVDYFFRNFTHLTVMDQTLYNQHDFNLLVFSDSDLAMAGIRMLSSRHMVYQGLMPPETALEYKSDALRAVARSVGTGDAFYVALKGIVSLIGCEVMENGELSGLRAHIRAACHLLGIYYRRHRTRYNITIDMCWGSLYYFDVCLALSVMEAPLIPLEYREAFLHHDGSGCVSMMGVSSGIMSIAADIVTLDTERRQGRDPSQCHYIGKKLQENLLRYHIPESESSRTEFLREEAECYRWAVLLLSERAIQEHCRPAAAKRPPVELWVQRLFDALSRIPFDANVVCAILYPLFVCGCEVRSEEERSIIAMWFELLMDRQRLSNIDCSWELLQNFWRGDERNWARFLESNTSVILA